MTLPDILAGFVQGLAGRFHQQVVRGGLAGPEPAPFDQNAEGFQYGQNLNYPTPTDGPPPTGSGGASQQPVVNTPTPSK